MLDTLLLHSWEIKFSLLVRYWALLLVRYFCLWEDRVTTCRRLPCEAVLLKCFMLQTRKGYDKMGTLKSFPNRWARMGCCDATPYDQGDLRSFSLIPIQPGYEANLICIYKAPCHLAANPYSDHWKYWGWSSSSRGRGRGGEGGRGRGRSFSTERLTFSCTNDAIFYMYSLSCMVSRRVIWGFPFWIWSHRQS